MAAEVAEANGVFVDPQDDVQFGKRIYNPSTGDWTVQWGGAPYNVVKVTARRNGADTSAPGRRIPAGLRLGRSARTACRCETSSTAFTEARDLVLVLDCLGVDERRQLAQLVAAASSTVDDLLDGMWDSLRRGQSEMARHDDLEVPEHRLRHASIRTTAPTCRAPTRRRSAARSA